MTPLEKRLIEDMKLFGYSKRTQDTYLYAVRKVTNHFQTSPDQITNEQLREYLLWHKEKYAPNAITTGLYGAHRPHSRLSAGWLNVLDSWSEHTPALNQTNCQPSMNQRIENYTYDSKKPTDMRLRSPSQKHLSGYEIRSL